MVLNAEGTIPVESENNGENNGKIKEILGE